MTACTDIDPAHQTSNEGTANDAMQPTKVGKRDKDLDELLLAAPKLSLKDAIKKYVTVKIVGGEGKVDTQTLTKAADRALELGDNDTAEVMLDEALRLDSNNGEAYFQRGRSRCNGVSGKDQEAIADLKKAISLGAGGAPAHCFLARLYDEHNQQDKALAELTEALRIDPNNKVAYRCRAAIFDAMGQKENALKDYQQLSKNDPKNTTNFFRIAQVYEGMKKYDEAIAAYLKLTEQNDTKQRIPLKPIAYKRLAALSSMKGSHKKSIEYLTEAIKLDNGDDEPLRLRGQEWMKLNDYEQAIADYTKAIELSPELSLTYQARSAAYKKVGKMDLAQKDLIEAQRLADKPAELPTYEVHHQ